MPSEGNAISAYSPAFAAGAKVYGANINCEVITGTVISAGVVEAKAHTLGAEPAFVSVVPWLVVGDVVSATSAVTIYEAAASGATSANFYVAGNVDGLKFKAFLLI